MCLLYGEETVPGAWGKSMNTSEENHYIQNLLFSNEKWYNEQNNFLKKLLCSMLEIGNYYKIKN